MLKADHEVQRQIYAMRGVASATVIRAGNYAAFARAIHDRLATTVTEQYHKQAQEALERARSALNDLSQAKHIEEATFDFERVLVATHEAAEIVDAANQLLENNREV